MITIKQRSRCPSSLGIEDVLNGTILMENKDPESCNSYGEEVLHHSGTLDYLVVSVGGGLKRSS